MPCALCSADTPVTAFAVTGGPNDAFVDLCATCIDQINGTPQPTHWRCLSSAMWSE
ncbi:MAG: protein PhnA, partial [Paracoccaceae bacterium]